MPAMFRCEDLRSCGGGLKYRGGLGELFMLLLCLRLSSSLQGSVAGITLTARFWMLRP